MGQAVTALKRRALKPLQNFAVEARAERVISRDKPTPAPWHPTTVQKIAELSKAAPPAASDADAKDAELARRLESVYVTSSIVSTDVPTTGEPAAAAAAAAAPAAVQRGRGRYERRPGKLTLTEAVAMIGRHRDDPLTCTAHVLAKENTIDPAIAGHILEHFRTFELHRPDGARQLTLADRKAVGQLPPPSEPAT